MMMLQEAEIAEVFEKLGIATPEDRAKYLKFADVGADSPSFYGGFAGEPDRELRVRFGGPTDK